MSARTILNPPLINELNGLFSGTTPIDVPEVTVGNTLTIQNGVGSPNDVALSCTSNDTLNVGGTVNATSVGIISPAGAVGLTAGASNTLIVGGNVQADAVGTESLSLQSGASSVSLTNITGIISTNSPIGTNSSVSANTFIGGIVCANWVPASPLACTAGAYTSTTCVIQNVPTSINYANCVYSFQAQAINAQTGCVPVVFPSYTATLNGNDLTLTIYISVAAGSAGAAINYISIMIINPGYGAVAP